MEFKSIEFTGDHSIKTTYIDKGKCGICFNHNCFQDAQS